MAGTHGCLGVLRFTIAGAFRGPNPVSKAASLAQVCYPQVRGTRHPMLLHEANRRYH